MKLWKGSIEDAVRAFKNHEARYVRGESFDVLDWKKPGTIQHWVRMVFDHEREDTKAVYITGDLGEAVVYPTCPATLFGMARCFTYKRSDGLVDINESYFLEKVKTGSRLYDWGMEEFKDDLREMFVQKYGKDEDQSALENFFEEHCEGYFDDITIDDRMGVQMGGAASDDLHSIFYDYYEWISGCGQRVSPYVVFWLVAMRLAYEQVKNAD